MKLIITEKQFRLIIESEKEDKGENLMDLTDAYEGGLSPDKWDDYFLFVNEKRGTNYDGYYIDGNVDLSKSDITELKYLVKVEGNLDLSYSSIKSLPMLSEVGDYLDLRFTPIKSLPMLSTVRGSLYLRDTLITELPMLSYVGGFLYLRDTPLSNKTTKEELKSKINVGGEIHL